MKQCLHWPPWATRQEIETILSGSHHPRWPRLFCVAVAGVIMHTLPMETQLKGSKLSHLVETGSRIWVLRLDVIKALSKPNGASSDSFRS